MKKFMTLLLIISNTIVHAQTYVSGFISPDTTWTVAGSPYIIVSNALVSQGDTLTIEPGVVVKFDAHCALQIDGVLIAVGTPSSRITFTSNQPSPASGDWDKLHFSGYCIGATFNGNGDYLSGSIMKYCDVLYAGGAGYGAVHIESSWPYISQCNVRLSKAAGIYCAGSTFVLDSSLVADNTDYGLYFDTYSDFSCGLLIRSDTIKNNKTGGLCLGSCNSICSTIIKDNYFVANSNNGAILALLVDINLLTISENYFISNTSSINYRGIVTVFSPTNDTIECNLFLNNQTSGNPTATLYMGVDHNSGVIRNNIFDGNINNSGRVAAFSVNCASSTVGLDFYNNTIRNCSSPLGTTCYFSPYLANNQELLRIHDNTFYSNTSRYVIELDAGPINNVNYDFMYMKHNNFLDVNYEIELYNHIAYGSPNVYADSNYWGSTSTSHIDSIICDYFDSTNYSVVYYKPILNQQVEIGSICSLGFPTTFNVPYLTKADGLPFPNPFTSYTEFLFASDLHNAKLILYDVLGKRIKEIENINGNKILLNREYLIDGLYIYQVIENANIVAKGKLMVD